MSETQTETGVIYLLKDKTEKCYVGQTIDIKKRIKSHTDNIKNKNTPCSSKALDIDFTYEILEDNIEKGLLGLRERYWYDLYREKCCELLVNINRPFNDIKKYTEDHKDSIKEYQKQFYEDHKDSIKERQKQYREDHKDRAKQYYEDHKDSLREKAKKYYEDNKEKINQYRKDHKDILRERTKKYYEDNIEKINQYRKDHKHKESLREKTNCECGGKYTRGSKSKHYKTKKHIDYDTKQKQ